MVVASVLNVILDPIFIFGLFGFPRLELAGAVLATVVSRAVSLVWALYVMHAKCRLIDLSRPTLARIISSWKSILHIGVPASLTNILMPLSGGVVVRLIADAGRRSVAFYGAAAMSEYGAGAVAGHGAATRVERFTYMVPMAMGSILVPFIGQNWGAGKADRARRAWVLTNVFGIAYGLVCFLVSLPLAAPVARLFSDKAEVIHPLVWYLWLVLAGSGMQHVSVHSGFALNALARPFSAAAYNAIRMLVLLLPLAYLGSLMWGVRGVFAGMALATVLSGVLAMVWVGRYFRDGGGRATAA
jgi:Na+-driven multidrug efflux pump